MLLAEPAAELTLPPIVLVLDDDPAGRYAPALTGAGMWAASARDVKEALEYARDMRPDAILSNLSADTGASFTKQLRADPVTKAIPIVAIEATEEARTEPATLYDEIVSRTAPLTNLAERIRAVIARSAGLHNREVRVRSRPPALRSGPERLRGRAAALVSAPPITHQAARPCPRCARPLRWIERREILGVMFDYYRPCEHGCGLFCYDRAQRTFVTLIG